LVPIVLDHFDALRLRVPECVAHRLASNPVDFVPDQRSQLPGPALHLDMKLGKILTAHIGSEFRRKLFFERAERAYKVVGNHRGLAQALHRIPALGDRLPGLLDQARQRLFCFGRAIPDQVGPFCA
jgi:hypothetical protein